MTESWLRYLRVYISIHFQESRHKSRWRLLLEQWSSSIFLLWSIITLIASQETDDR